MANIQSIVSNNLLNLNNDEKNDKNLCEDEETNIDGYIKQHTIKLKSSSVEISPIIISSSTNNCFILFFF